MLFYGLREANYVRKNTNRYRYKLRREIEFNEVKLFQFLYRIRIFFFFCIKKARTKGKGISADELKLFRRCNEPECSCPCIPREKRKGKIQLSSFHLSSRIFCTNSNEPCWKERITDRNFYLLTRAFFNLSNPLCFLYSL